MEIAVAFVARLEPLAPTCVVGIGDVARALGERVLRLADAELGALRGLAARGTLLVLAPTERLPWVDGASFLGQDADAPRLLLPTQRRPSVAVDIFERAVLRRVPVGSSPVAVLVDPPRLIPLATARELARAPLRAWLSSTA